MKCIVKVAAKATDTVFPQTSAAYSRNKINSIYFFSSCCKHVRFKSKAQGSCTFQTTRHTVQMCIMYFFKNWLWIILLVGILY